MGIGLNTEVDTFKFECILNILNVFDMSLISQCAYWAMWNFDSRAFFVA